MRTETIKREQRAFVKLSVRFSVVLLHQNPKDTAKSVSFGFLRSFKGSAPREIHPRSVMANICSNAGGCALLRYLVFARVMTFSSRGQW